MSVVMSLWALVSGLWSAWQAARVEINQQDEAEKREQADVPAEIVERIVARTNVRADVDLAPTDGRQT